MTVYRAAVLFMTAVMLVLHVLEWKTVAAAPALEPCSVAGSWARKLRLALRLEALYYLLVLPLLWTAPNTLVSRLFLISAVYHCGGLALLERSDVLCRPAAIGQASKAERLGIVAIALLDLGEMVLLTCLWRTLFNSLIR